MYVRILKKRLSTGHQRGEIVPGETFKQLNALIRHHAVAEVHPPPLSEIVGWTTRAELLADHGIVDVVQFLEAENETLRDIFNYKSDRVINRMKAEVRQALLPSGATLAMRR